MALHIEYIINDLQTYLQAKLPAQLVLASVDNLIGQLPVPRNEDYFIGEPSRYQAYQAPAVFLISEHTKRPAITENGWNQIQKQDHTVNIDVVIENRTEEFLTRGCWRYAEAFDAVLDGADITGAPTLTTPPGAARDWSAEVFVTNIDYGVLFTREHREQRIFRKDILIDLLIKHWDQRTPMG